jgi:hypothetical protein
MPRVDSRKSRKIANSVTAVEARIGQQSANSGQFDLEDTIPQSSHQGRCDGCSSQSNLRNLFARRDVDACRNGMAARAVLGLRRRFSVHAGVLDVADVSRSFGCNPAACRPTGWPSRDALYHLYRCSSQYVVFPALSDSLQPDSRGAVCIPDLRLGHHLERLARDESPEGLYGRTLSLLSAMTTYSSTYSRLPSSVTMLCDVTIVFLGPSRTGLAYRVPSQVSSTT